MEKNPSSTPNTTIEKIMKGMEKKKRKKTLEKEKFEDEDTQSEGFENVLLNAPEKKKKKKGKNKRHKSQNEQSFTIFEPCEYENERCTLPIMIFQLTNLRSILNMNNYQTFITEEEKLKLQEFLPNQLDKSLQEEILKKLFEGENFFFGNPIEQFFQYLKDGIFHPSVNKYRTNFLSLQRNNHYHNLISYHLNMIEKCSNYSTSYGYSQQNKMPFYPNYTIEYPIGSFERRIEKVNLSEIREETEDELPENDNSGDDTLNKPLKDQMKPKSKYSKTVKKRKLEEIDSKHESLFVGSFPIFIRLKDLFFSSNFSLTLNDICLEFSNYFSNFIIDKIPSNFTLNSFFESVLKYLSSPPSIVTSNLIVEHNVDKWNWLLDQELETMNNLLITLEQLFFFAICRNDKIEPSIIIKSVISKPIKSINTIPPSSEKIVLEFRKQEKIRFSNPSKPFTYILNGIKSVVAPVISKKKVIKMRDHFLLKEERPPYVTLSGLVRDAMSRLPGGIGTRLDISLLLKDSQFVVENADENSLHSVVSGTLDRLHYEEDPCAAHLTEFKLWVYLHRNRKESDFISLSHCLETNSDEPDYQIFETSQTEETLKN